VRTARSTPAEEPPDGQRQRVAMGHVIGGEPQVFLMDELLSNLDARVRVRLRAEIGAFQHRHGPVARRDRLRHPVTTSPKAAAR